ncbi:MAG: class I SAM-dependent methyltransferase [Lentisphaeraceae bacterium]|nr:class I SAM-dependent methyltransferase [Lentisphaeraceae bacterium]
MNQRLCTDSRCLYYANGSKTNQSDFECVTTETREGKGRWERCNTCGLSINRSGVEPDGVSEYYNETYIKNHSFSEGEILSAREHFEARQEVMVPTAEYLKPFLTKDMNIMELGAGTGELLNLLKGEVKSCFGNEINELFSSFMEQELKISASAEDYFKLDLKEKFDCIITLYTIDHMYDTGKAVEKMFTDLKPGGLFYIEVPNDLQALKTFLPEPARTSFQTFMYQEAHYYSFTMETLKKLVEDSGYTILESFSKHNYTIVNFLNWYFTGTRQKKHIDATNNTHLFAGKSGFETEMNELFEELDSKFKNLMSKYEVGESLCILARKPLAADK